MEKRTLFLFVSLTLLLLASCGKTNCGCDDAAPPFQLAQESGTMRYDDKASSWCIYSPLPGTYDSVRYFMVPDIDKSFQKDGLQVRFSGEAVKSSFAPAEIPVGYEYYCITITDMEYVQ